MKDLSTWSGIIFLNVFVMFVVIAHENKHAQRRNPANFMKCEKDYFKNPYRDQSDRIKFLIPSCR